MKTSERRELADRALHQIDTLELEIRAQMAKNNIRGELEENYANFKAYSKLRELHEQYAELKRQHAVHADNHDLVKLVGQSEHDILRENYPKITSETQIISIPTTDSSYLYERDSGTMRTEKINYTVRFEKIRILPFQTCHSKELDSLFIRVNRAGVAH